MMSWLIAIVTALVIAEDSPLVSLLRLLHLEAVADALSKLGFIHLFFLFVPVWLLTSMLYIIFSSMAGVREKLADQPAEQIPTGSSAESAGRKEPTRQGYAKDPVLIICAIIALASLAACVILPLWVYLSDRAVYLKNQAAFKSILIWPTLIYFVTATIWNLKRSRSK